MSKRMGWLVLASACAISANGCSSSRELQGDGSVSDAGTDAPLQNDTSVVFDAGRDTSVRDSGPPPARCGDGEVNVAGEICDDGNNVSGDGCRADCLSDESCGNNIVDFSVAEACDDGNQTANDGCTACRIDGCGDGTVNGTEQCDDSNTLSFDGCGRDCTIEKPFVIDNSIAFSPAGVGCDLTGDGQPDNAFASASSLIGTFLNSQLQGQVQMGNLLILLLPQGLADASGQNGEFRMAWLQGQDADSNASNNFTGQGSFRTQASSFDPATGAPMISLQSRLTNRALSAGPEDVALDLGVFELLLRRAMIEGTGTGTATEWNGISPARLCGGLSLKTLGAISGQQLYAIAGMGSAPPACDPSDPNWTMADLFVGGGSLFNIVPIRATPPDVDVDGDGLETFEIRTGDNCQPVIVGCTDGNGNASVGRNCFNAPGIEDGLSASLNIRGVRASLVPAQ